MKMYKYTILRQDGTKEVLPPSKKKSFAELYKILNCTTIEIIPKSYYGKEGHCTMFGDEEGRFVETNRRNPHFKDLGNGYFVVGDIVKEEKIK